MLLDEELGRLGLHPFELVDGVVVEAEFLAVELALDEPAEHARGELLGRRLGREVVAQVCH